MVIGFPSNYYPDTLKKKLRALKDLGSLIFNGAYMVRGNYGEDKIASVIDYTITPLYESPIIINSRSMEITWDRLGGRYGFGSFMAGQVVADLRWASPGAGYYIGEEWWCDRSSWAPMGPGSKRGMNRLRGLPINKPMTQKEFETLLQTFMVRAKLSLPQEITSRIEAMDYQNCLCEYDKYCRVLDGGESKRLYKR